MPTAMAFQPLPKTGASYDAWIGLARLDARFGLKPKACYRGGDPPTIVAPSKKIRKTLDWSPNPENLANTARHSLERGAPFSMPKANT